jgi:hypothetical protein
LAACEKALFASPESVAAAVSYAAASLSRLTAAGDVATANVAMTPDLLSLRRAVERDRYGLMAYVLLARDHCTPSECAVFASLTDRSQIAANMDQRVYEGLVLRYASSWNAPPPSVAAAAAIVPSPGASGKPTNAEFPSASSTPPVSIMSPEPGTTPARLPAANTPTPSPRPTPPPAPAKKQAASKGSHAAAPVPLAPAAPAAND